MASPGLLIRRHESPHARWEIVERAPDPRLAGLVHSYTGFDERNATPMRRREVPGSRIPLIIGFGPPLWVDGVKRSSFVAGLHDRPSITEYRGESCGIQVDLRPLGARRFLGIPMHELTTRVVPVGDVLGRDVELFIEALAETRTWEERFAALDDAILRHVADAPHGSREVAWAWRELERTAGGVPIATLAQGSGWSARRFIARFRDEVGVTPKLAARILRFEGVISRIERAGGDGWADIAYDCGYYDQSHLNRDFRQFAGTTPTEFVASLLPDGFGIGVNSVQDEAARAA